MVGCTQKKVLKSKVRKRKVIRVESSVGFVPSAFDEPRGPICWSDNRCSEKAVRYWQIASMVLKKVERPTQSFMSAVLQRTVGAARQAATEIVAMERSSGKEAALREDVVSDRK